MKTTKKLEKKICSEYLKGRENNTYSLGKKYNLGKTTINRILVRNGIKLRNATEARCNLTPAQEKKICAEYQRSRENNTTTLGNKYNLAPGTILSILKRNGIKSRNNIESHSDITFVQEKKICLEYQKSTKNSSPALSRIYGISSSAIRTILKRNGIKRRTLSEAKDGPTHAQEKKICSEYLRGKHNNTITLGKKYNLDHKTILAILRRNSVRTRNAIEARSGLTPTQQKKICSEYLEGNSACSLGEKYNLDDSTIGEILKRNGIKSRTLSQTLKLAHKNGSFDKAKLQGKYSSKQANEFWRAIEKLTGIKFERNKYNQFTYVLEGVEFDAKYKDKLYEFDGQYFHADEDRDRIYRRRILAEKYNFEVVFIPANGDLKKALKSLANWIMEEFKK